MATQLGKLDTSELLEKKKVLKDQIDDLYSTRDSWWGTKEKDSYCQKINQGRNLIERIDRLIAERAAKGITQILGELNISE